MTKNRKLDFIRTTKVGRKKRLTLRDLARMYRRNYAAVLGHFDRFERRYLARGSIGDQAAMLAGEVQRLHNLRLGERMAQLDTMMGQLGLRLDRIVGQFQVALERPATKAKAKRKRKR